MESSSIYAKTIVPVDLDDSNYEIWSSCLEGYLLSQDLWDVVIEEEPEAAQENDLSSSDSSKSNRRRRNNIKRWRKKTATALHAIRISCGPNFLCQVTRVKSAKEAWDLLATSAGSKNGAVDETKTVVENESTKDDIDYVPLIKAVKDVEWRNLEKFFDCHPQSVTATVFSEGGTALHYLVKYAL